ncbi:hypothetical protein EZJ19_09790 [Parasulfuritortus cantonensis]|uniref:ATP-grasp domain-containing protein n=1 Tax=Parasulfuritortus cantonensis TaxID=2528202 RepID=A0A4R1BA59_9PROT|nr:hypothetical protein [Parasulfuritortus cantonensis]TCJ13820.1 hypothetical protein EZJ19_09790 [Parasulfuritortus cantonensis]
MSDIAIFVDDSHRFARQHYFLHLMMEEWRHAGWRIRLCEGTRRPPDADLALLHVDLTRLPDDYLDLAGRYPSVVNGAAVDISKRRISRYLVTRDDAYAGPVIVKTDANCGGIGERARRYRVPLLGRLRRSLDRRRHWTRAAFLTSGDYPIYPGKEAVPAAVWDNPALVVERFLAERRGSQYCLRQWVFFGERELNKISYSEHPIIKANTVIGSELLGEVPETLRAMRAELAVDYGKFDYVMQDGEAILLDANRTPTYGNRLGPKAAEYAALLASGLTAFQR